MTASETEREPRLLPRLTAFRWYAALVVFLFHLAYQIHWRPLNPFSIGPVGVSFFYVLSGFVLTWSFRFDRSPWRFYRRRFARIYPAMLASQLLAAVLVAAGLFNLRGGALGAITSIFLIQAWFPGSYPVYAYNSVAWSLSCEAFFYGLLPLLIFASAGWGWRKVLAATSGFLGAGLLATVILVHTGHGTGIAYHNPLVRLPEFIVGVGLALLVDRGWRPSFPMWQALTVLIVSAAAAHHWALFFSQPLNDYLLLPGIVGLLLSGIGLDIRGRRGLLTARVSVYLGELSFCFYLIHLLVLFAIVRAAGWSHQRFSLVGGAVPLLTVLAASIAAAAVLHHGIELPMQRLLRPKRQASVARPG